jgi:uncharacterized damage-inducible protein DinB
MLQFIHQQLVHETKTTRRVLAATPDDNSGYRPDPKSMTALELVQHIAFSDMFFLSGAIAGKFEVPNDRSFLDAFDTPSKVVAEYEARSTELLGQIEKLSPEQASKQIQLFGMTQSAVEWLQFGMKHTIHHRGQLSVYLRPMGAKVPSIYGGSADEPNPGRPA